MSDLKIAKFQYSEMMKAVNSLPETQRVYVSQKERELRKSMTDAKVDEVVKYTSLAFFVMGFTDGIIHQLQLPKAYWGWHRKIIEGALDDHARQEEK